MNTKKRLNCYIFSNLIISFLSLNFLLNDTTKTLCVVENQNNNSLHAIYEKQEIVPAVTNTNQTVNKINVTKKTVQSKKTINYVKPSYNSVTGSNLVEYSKHYLGLAYVSGGYSLTSGTDCSGFTKLIYQEFGISLGRTVNSQLYSGKYVSKADLQPGDLVFYGYTNYATHVAIYIGNGLVIHESNPRDGVKLSSVNMMVYITARRVITAEITTTPNDSEEVVSSEAEITDTKEEVSSNDETSDTKKEENIETNTKTEEVTDIPTINEETKIETKEETTSIPNLNVESNTSNDSKVNASIENNNVGDTNNK